MRPREFHHAGGIGELRQQFGGHEAAHLDLAHARRGFRGDPGLFRLERHDGGDALQSVARPDLAHQYARHAFPEIHPGPQPAVARLERVDVRYAAQGELDGVQPLEQPQSCRRIDGEAQRTGRRRTHLVVSQVDAQPFAARRTHRLGEPAQRLGRQRRRQHTVVHAIVEENRCEGLRQYRADAVFAQRPDGVLAARAAAEIVARPGDARPRVGRLVQHELRFRAPAGEQPRRETGLADAFDFSRGNDGVGVDVVAQQRDRHTGQRLEGLEAHGSNSRTSAMRPRTALAATVAGLAMWVRVPGPWRPSKFRLVEETTRLPSPRSSPPA